MSQQREDRARQKFAEKMRQKSLTARNAKATVKNTPENKAASTDGDAGKKD